MDNDYQKLLDDARAIGEAVGELVLKLRADLAGETARRHEGNEWHSKELAETQRKLAAAQEELRKAMEQEPFGWVQKNALESPELYIGVRPPAYPGSWEPVFLRAPVPAILSATDTEGRKDE